MALDASIKLYGADCVALCTAMISTSFLLSEKGTPKQRDDAFNLIMKLIMLIAKDNNISVEQINKCMLGMREEYKNK